MKRLCLYSLIMLIALAVLSACTLPAKPKVVNVPDVPAGGAVQLYLGPATGETTDRPLMYVTAPIVDSVTGQPLQANVFVVESVEEPTREPSEMVQQGVTQVAVALPQDGERTVWLIVQAEGYQPWSLRFQSHLVKDKVFEGTIRLLPAGQKA